MDCTAGLISCQLDRIADTLSGFDWNGLLATFIATVAGAVVATFVSLWANDRSRPRPHWRATASAPSSFKDGTGSVAVTVTNIGDGVAYNPGLSILGADSPAPAPREALLEPGQSTHVTFLAAGEGRHMWSPVTDVVEDTRRIVWPRDIRVVVEWQEPPKRHRVRRQSLPLENPIPETA